MYPGTVFVDTSAWVALADMDDANHSRAADIYPVILKEHKSLITSNFIVAESYIVILNNLGHKSAVSFLERINTSPRILKVRCTEDIEKAAEEILKKYRDQDFSYTDAVSFVIMKKQKINKVFCFDTHFKTMGFIKLP